MDTDRYAIIVRDEDTGTQFALGLLDTLRHPLDVPPDAPVAWWERMSAPDALEVIRAVLGEVHFALSKLGISHEEFVRGLPPRQFQLAQDGLEDVVVRVDYVLEAARVHEEFLEDVKARGIVDHADQ